MNRHFGRLDAGLRLLHIKLKLDQNALTGGIRAAVMAHMPLAECSLSVEDLRRAGEIFLTYSLGTRPVTKFDDKAFAVGQVATHLAAEL